MLYQQKYDKSLNSTRAALFARKVVGKRHVPPKLSSLPPTMGAFRLHCARAHYQTVLWKSAGKPSPPTLAPEHFGWEKRANMLQPVYLSDDKAVVPDEVLHLISCGCKSGCKSAMCNCMKFNLSIMHRILLLLRRRKLCKCDQRSATGRTKWS